MSSCRPTKGSRGSFGSATRAGMSQTAEVGLTPAFNLPIHHSLEGAQGQVHRHAKRPRKKSNGCMGDSVSQLPNHCIKILLPAVTNISQAAKQSADSSEALLKDRSHGPALLGGCQRGRSTLGMLLMVAYGSPQVCELLAGRHALGVISEKETRSATKLAERSGLPC